MGRRRRVRKQARRASRSGFPRLGPQLRAQLLSLLAQPLVQRALLAALVYVIALNAVVRYVGHGDAFLLSPLRLPEKSYAVGLLGLHSVRHLWSSHDDEDLRALVAQAAIENDVPIGLALAIAKTESGLRPHCISATGAMGLMQLMPATALAHGVLDAFDPISNARGATHFLRELAQRYGGDRARIAAAYNAGAGRVPRTGSLDALPAETRTYVTRVTGATRVTSAPSVSIY